MWQQLLCGSSPTMLASVCTMSGLNSCTCSMRFIASVSCKFPQTFVCVPKLHTLRFQCAYQGSPPLSTAGRVLRPLKAKVCSPDPLHLVFFCAPPWTTPFLRCREVLRVLEAEKRLLTGKHTASPRSGSADSQFNSGAVAPHNMQPAGGHHQFSESADLVRDHSEL